MIHGDISWKNMKCVLSGVIRKITNDFCAKIVLFFGLMVITKEQMETVILNLLQGYIFIFL
jgi:hypothetical protein